MLKEAGPLSAPPPTPRGTDRMSVTTDRRGATHVVTVRGEVDLTTAPRLTHDVAEVIDRAQEGVVLDLGPVAFLDSAALHALVALAAHARSKDIKLTILPACDEVHLPFVVTGLDQVLPFSAAIR
jgi:anti-sigma B factor antagonist